MSDNAQKILAEATLALSQAGIGPTRLEARCLLAQAVGCTPDELLYKYISIDKAAEEAFAALLQRRLAREPMAQILGHKEFWSLDFQVNRHTLTPRPDSETLIEAVLAYFPDKQASLRILDLGTGTGCLLLSLLCEWPRATGIGVDISGEALEVAKANAKQLGLGARATLQLGNWCDGIQERFDLIVSNPPYLAESDRDTLMPDVRDWEPETALYAGADGLEAYRAMLPQAKNCLKPQGFVAVECGVGQAQPVEIIGKEAGLTPHEVKRDLAGIERVVTWRSE